MSVVIHKRVFAKDAYGAQVIRSACGKTGRLADIWHAVTCRQCLKYQGRVE